jgi:hypothetical protein
MGKVAGILKRFPHRRHPSSDRTKTIGFVVPDRKRVGGIDRTVRTPDPDTEGVVLQSFMEDVTRSVRNVADILNQ